MNRITASEVYLLNAMKRTQHKAISIHNLNVARHFCPSLCYLEPYNDLQACMDSSKGLVLHGRFGEMLCCLILSG